MVTLKKLQVSPDAFSFSDKVLENWYPTAEIGDKKGVFLLVGGSKEGALSGGPAFMKTLGEGETTRTGRRIPPNPPPAGIGERLTAGRLPQGSSRRSSRRTSPRTSSPTSSSTAPRRGASPASPPSCRGRCATNSRTPAGRVSAGTDLTFLPSPVQEVPNGPKAPTARNTDRTYKTKAETKKGNYGAILIALLTIATVVPMVQYWSYVREE